MTTIKIRGPIVDADEAWIYEWFDMQHTTAEKVEQELEKATGKVTVVINSPGGSVYEANEIYHALKKYGETNELTVEIAGIAASAASYIATAADDVAISPLAQIMIHNASAVGRGDYRDMQHTSDLLQKVNKSIVNAYMMKTGLPEEELLKMMDDETYFGAQEAVDKGFANRILFDDGTVKFAASAKGEGFLPRDVIEKMKKEASSKKVPDAEKPKDTSKSNFKVNEAKPKDKKSVEGGKDMTYEELKENHPELFNQIKSEGKEEGRKEENARIKSIDDLGHAGMQDLINKAKYEEPMNAGELAIAILNKQKAVGQTHIQNIEEDAEGIKDVEPQAPDKNKEEEDAKNVAEATAKLENIFATGGVL